MMAIYEFEKSKPRELRRIYTGEKSLRFILEDSQDKASNIELHSRVPRSEFERRFPDSYIAGAPAPKTPVRRLAQEPEEEAPVDQTAERIEDWRRKGFKVDTLEEASGTPGRGQGVRGLRVRRPEAEAVRGHPQQLPGDGARG